MSHETKNVWDGITDSHIEDLRRRGATQIAQRMERAQERDDGMRLGVINAIGVIVLLVYVFFKVLGSG